MFDRLFAARVDTALRGITTGVHERLKSEPACARCGNSQIDCRRAANIAGYRKLVQAVVDDGLV